MMHKALNSILTYALRSCVVSLLVLLSSSGVTAQVEVTNQEVPIQIRLKPDKKSIMLGEALFVTFEVTNVSGEKLCLGVGGDYRNKYGRPDSFSVSVKTDEGAELPRLEAVSFGGFVSCAPIEVGATYTVRLFLPHWATIERTGSYRVNVKRTMTFKSYVPSGSTTLKYSMLADVDAEFIVVPAEHNKIGELIGSLGSIMLDISDPRAVESARVLASIHDERVISYFAEALRKFRDSDDDFGHLNHANICYNSIAALAKYDDDRAIDALQAAMKSPNESIRLAVAEAFADSPHRSGLKLLLRMKSDSYWFVRLRVAQRLETVNTQESRVVLQKLLKDEKEEVRKAATESLNKLNQ
jgi:HEAT repeats